MLVIHQLECIILFNLHMSLLELGHVIIPILQVMVLKLMKFGKLYKVTQQMENPGCEPMWSNPSTPTLPTVYTSPPPLPPY